MIKLNSDLKVHRTILVFLVVLSIGQTGVAQKEHEGLRLPAIISDHMVLQNGSEIPVWGWASPGEAVTIQIEDQEVQTNANRDGKWKAELNALNSGGPLFMKVITSDTTILVRDILVGEVWLGSGQSNMEWPMNRISDAEKHIQVAYFPEIRFFTVKRNKAGEPLDDCEGKWVLCNPQTTDPFSAVAYFFGRVIHQQLSVPVGLIHSSWGGTPAESWTSSETISGNPRFGKIESNFIQAQSKYETDRPKFNKTLRSALLRPVNRNLNSAKGIWDFISKRGGQHFQSTMNISIKDGQLIVDIGWSATPATNVEFSEGKLSFTFQIEPSSRFPDPFQVSGIFRGETFKGSIQSGESENSEFRAVKRIKNSDVTPRLLSPQNVHLPSELYNAMLHPIAPFAIKGVIWYQGESNTSRAYDYRDLFPAMIQDWRDLWGRGNLPFYFVQIAPFKYQTHGIAAELREAQLMTLSVPNTGMVVTTDIATIDDIHPPNKIDVGKRLALWALANDYDQEEIIPSGPLYKEMIVEGNRVRIKFDYTGEGLVALDHKITHFTIAGKDRQFLSAEAKIEGHDLVVWSNQVAKPVAVRFGWSNTAEPNLFNHVGLPASPFRTDDWPGITEQ